jgi:hypothetical protein
VPKPSPVAAGSEDSPQESYLSRELGHQIAAFDKRRYANARLAATMRLLIVGMSALTTVMLGLKIDRPGWDERSRNVALGLTALATMIGTWESFYDHRALWIRYTRTATALKGLRAELRFRQAKGPVSSGVEEELFSKMREVLEATNGDWLTLRIEAQRKERVGSTQPSEAVREKSAENSGPLLT